VVLEAYHREQQRLEASLLAQGKSEARFQSLMMNAPLPIFVANSRGEVDCVNHSFEQVLGYCAEDIPLAKIWWERAYPDPGERAVALARWRASCAEAQSTGSPVLPREYSVTCKDGRIAQMEVQAAVVEDQWLVMFTDVSERRRGEAALRQTQKLESLGVLAGGIAHDFNNLLSAMMGNLDLAQVKLPIGSASAPFLANMEGTIVKAAELTRQMLAYSGKGSFVVEPMDLNRLVAELTHLLVVSISKKVKLEYDLAAGLPPIEADLAQVQQVVMNLVTNASEAFGDSGGVITLSTGLRDIHEGELEAAFPGQTLEPGSYVTLKVSDNGCGMEPQVIARIFDPFFSTKGSGRGLGLSAMLGILRGHRAGIAIQSNPGEGSAFQIFFRASHAKLPESVQVESGAHKDRFHGKALLVDDEPELRFSFGSMLQHLGFRVVAARDGYEALERFSPGEFAFVLMDLTMPRMDGKEAFFQMKARDPEVKVVLASGYSEQEAIEPLAGLRPAGFIQKPFSLEALTRVIERALE
jgi:PAS domain S-box-containing protein